MNYSRVAGRLRGKMGEFSGVLSHGLPKVAQRFVTEMVYGIQASQSVVLTEIARVLEERIKLKETEERLSRQLAREGLGEQVQDNLLRLGGERVGDRTLLITDIGDVQKKYARKMEYLALVRDGSEEEVGPGYWTCQVVAAEVDGDALVPLYHRLYSAEAPDFRSENGEILHAVETVANHTGGRGIWVIDRGGDRNKLFNALLDRKRHFLIRLHGNRHLVCGRNTRTALELALSCPCPYTEVIIKEDEGRERDYQVSFGFRKVRLPHRGEQLYLLVVKGLAQEPLMVLTDLPLRRSRKVLWWMVRAYFRRWAIEETIRFIKQSYQLEDVRVLTYRSLQNLMPLVLAAAYFAAVVLDTGAKLTVMTGCVLKAAKRLFGIPDFRYYAIADGLRNLFRRHPGTPKTPPMRPDPQLRLFEPLPP